MGPVTQEDPIGIAGGLNLYGYANGDPINYSDPFGLDCFDRNGNQRPCGVLDLVSVHFEVGLFAEAQVQVGGVVHGEARVSLASVGVDGTPGDLVSNGAKSLGDYSLLEVGADAGVGVSEAAATAGVKCGLTVQGTCTGTAQVGASHAKTTGEGVQRSRQGGTVGWRVGALVGVGVNVNFSAAVEIGRRLLERLKNDGN